MECYGPHRWSSRQSDGSKFCRDCGQINSYGVDPDQVIGGYAGQGTKNDPARHQAMTDINEIIGRALLTLDGTGHKREGVAMDSGWDVHRIVVDGTWLYTDIGAAVVKALREHGYAIVEDTRGEWG